MKRTPCENQKKFIPFFPPMTMVVILLMGIFSGCQMHNGIPITRPDLIPVCPADPINYCDIDIENLLLLVHVKNQGLADADASHVQVSLVWEAGENQDQIKPLPPISAEEIQTVGFDMSSGSWDADFNFEITVDIYDEIDETNEVNNTVTGFCANKMLSKEPSP